MVLIRKIRRVRLFEDHCNDDDDDDDDDDDNFKWQFFRQGRCDPANSRPFIKADGQLMMLSRSGKDQCVLHNGGYFTNGSILYTANMDDPGQFCQKDGGSTRWHLVG